MVELLPKWSSSMAVLLPKVSVSALLVLHHDIAIRKLTLEALGSLDGDVLAVAIRARHAVDRNLELRAAWGFLDRHHSRLLRRCRPRSGGFWWKPTAPLVLGRARGWTHPRGCIVAHAHAGLQRHLSFPQSSSASRFTAGAAGFLNLSQSQLHAA
jgi:hypothetical protein